MSDEKFKLPQSSYEELSKVIKAYGHFPEPAGLDEVSKFIGLHTTIISRNAGFLIGVGVLEAGAKKFLTANGRKLAHALEHDMPEEIRTWWRQIVSGNEFLTRLLAAIKIRNGMDQQTLEAHIAYSAGQPKRPQFMTGARTVIDILRGAELIKEADGKYIAERTEGTAIEPPPVLEVPLAPTTDKTPQRPTIAGVPLEFPTDQLSLVMRIQININCTAAEVSSLGQHIKKLMEELSSANPKPQANEKRGE